MPAAAGAAGPTRSDRRRPLRPRRHGQAAAASVVQRPSARSSTATPSRPNADAQLVDHRGQRIGAADERRGRAGQRLGLGPGADGLAGATDRATDEQADERPTPRRTPISATRCSASATVRVCSGGVKNQFSSRKAATAATSPTSQPADGGDHDDQREVQHEDGRQRQVVADAGRGGR